MKPLYYLIIVSLYSILQFNACNGSKENKVIEEGEKLAHSYCISCHAFPDPSLLDKSTWNEGVLPKMAEFMYVDAYYDPYSNNGPAGDMSQTHVKPGNLFPLEKWEKIVTYYTAKAPSEPLERPEKIPPVKMELSNFKIHPISLVDYPLSTFVNFDTGLKKIVIADGSAKEVFILNKELKVVDSMHVPLGVTDINHTSNGMEAISMGILKPSDEKLGKLSLITHGKESITLIDSLQRPVQATYADLNADGKVDIIISEFGFRKGSLSWFENKGTRNYERHYLKALPGAISSKLYDFDNDGKPDIITLMAQGDESIFIFYNEGNGKFREQRIIQFPPSYGSNHFELTDINKDGYMDIITTNGDNGDMSDIVKAYHGIRIFLNDGKNNFKERLFLPVNGAQKVIAKDFDGDGDIDMASIAFFPDYEHLPEESFIYWENKGDLSFQRLSFAGEMDGRWMTMDAGDMDGDGDIDIILGNAFFTLGKVPKELKDNWTRRPLSAIVLENTLHNKNIEKSK